jgi:myo-inositol 2-dehydrogenase/D-chiro-inositol 1-dehydrogenase
VCLTEVIGSEGRLSIGGVGGFDHVTLAVRQGVRHECTQTFYDRFEEAFLREDAEFVQAVLEDRAAPLTLRDATEATRIAIAMQQSLRERRVIAL